MRKLQTHDVFVALKLVKATELKEEVKRMALIVEKKKNVSIKDVGIEFILTCFEKLSGTEAEKAVYELLSGPLEISPEEIETMEPLELVEKLKEATEYINRDSLNAFFKSVAGLMEKLNS